MWSGIIFAVLTTSSTVYGALPVVIWHGMGDSCCNPLSMGSIRSLIEKTVGDDVYVRSLEIGNNVIEDTINGFFKNVNDQIEIVCKKVAADPKLKNGYNAIGFSQGGQFLRAVAQRCPWPSMVNLISIGGQHEGVYGLPHCHPGSKLCEYVRELLNFGAYASWIQDNVVQAEYWHDPLNADEYRKKSVFLADLNNENKLNESYKKNLCRLKNFVMVKFDNDTMVVPKESEWFGFYEDGQDEHVLTLRDREIYKKDRIGLRQMDTDGKLHFLSVVGDHLRIEDKWFVEEIVNKYLV